MGIYQAGCITVTSGSQMVEGAGTRWLNYTHAGDVLSVDGVDIATQSVNDNHLITLVSPWPGVSRNNIMYTIATAPYVKTLDEARVEAAIEVDNIAGQTRLRFITVSPGQEATYLSKLADANAYIAAGYPADATAFVWINAEAIATNATPQIVADLIVYTASQWSQVGAQIEGARQAAKQAILLSVNGLEINQAVENFKGITSSI